MRAFSTPVLLLAMLAVIAASRTDASVITADLTVGSTSAEVSALQQILVAQGYLIMPAGASYGYFGPLTRDATAKWQKANGISPAVGYFGPISRKVMDNKSSAATVSATTSSGAVISTHTVSTASTPASVALPSISPASGLRVNRVMLFRASPFEVRPGDSITLEGSGFSKAQNKVYLNEEVIGTASSTNGTIATILIPNSISEGQYKLSVSNELGSSENSNIPISIKVTNSPKSAPIIEQASISGETVTLTGKHFTSANTVLTTLGNSPTIISSTGTTISFTLSELSQYEQIKKQLKGSKYQLTLWIFVQTEHGVSKDPYRLDIMI